MSRTNQEYLETRLAGAPSRESLLNAGTESREDGEPTAENALQGSAEVPAPPWKGTEFKILDGLSDEERKLFPVFSGFLKYFPNACALGALQSMIGQIQHAPGEPLQWKRGKSSDHPDCMVRHLMEGGNHKVAAFWRAAAELEDAVDRGEVDVQALLEKCRPKSEA
jgi:hypothetical protein